MHDKTKRMVEAHEATSRTYVALVRDAVMLLRRAARVAPEPLSSTITDWLNEHAPTSPLRQAEETTEQY